MSMSAKDFLRAYNDAFIEPDVDFLVSHTSEDIRWEMVGETVIEGRAAFQEALSQMEGSTTLEMNVDTLYVTDGRGTVSGTMRTLSALGEEYHFAFCDLYEFEGDSELRVTKLTAYVITLTET
ncbi:hypothetical protein DL240_02615 [Lujinxingia litoralis]|uniref:SnoaL-like domain-containing protein n=1 Tax=Lujinxingia litoralis TaxID=2211119 RepID=A0A328C9I2_9DELT|nr:nuclear transport factor 2 family protein [Lujinxingia litoralis]RAL25125.1 hypothetical protein DL240_02615 [Lujinxingia litoralis]